MGFQISMHTVARVVTYWPGYLEDDYLVWSIKICALQRGPLIVLA
jgi:hypothetical protein